MSTRPFIALVLAALLLRPMAVAAAQDTTAAAQVPQDTGVQGYAPAEAAPAVQVLKEHSEKSAMARKVHASFVKFQEQLDPWDQVAQGAYHDLLKG